MKSLSNRRQFIKKVGSGAISVTLTYGLFKSERLLAGLSLSNKDDNGLPKINPAFRINIYQDGSIELYTYKAEGQIISNKLKGFEADILKMILENKDPGNIQPEYLSQYHLTDEQYRQKAATIINSFKEKGYIYFGDTMKVKVKKNNG
ncbi:MAG: hypothetical protein JW723_03865 [Bacteroidales bacterium]|nr:hypothetical protein [Bacteroidales bacterium]